MKEITREGKLVHRSSLQFMLTATLPLVILLMTGAVFFSGKAEGNEKPANCMGSEKEEDISFLHAMPFPLLPALEVAYPSPINSLFK